MVHMSAEGRKVATALIKIVGDARLFADFKKSPADVLKKQGLNQTSIDAIRSGNIVAIRQLVGPGTHADTDIVVVVIVI